MDIFSNKIPSGASKIYYLMIAIKLYLQFGSTFRRELAVEHENVSLVAVLVCM